MARTNCALKHVPYNELLKLLEATPIDQIEKLATYSRDQATWHQGYADSLDRVVRHRQKQKQVSSASAAVH